MSIRRELRAFWWFTDGKIGGMGKPGFNRCHWSELPLEEAAVFSWLGQHMQADAQLSALWAYLDSFGPKAAPFYGLSAAQVHERFARLREREVLHEVITRVNARAGILEAGFWLEEGEGARLHCAFDEARLEHELQTLQEHGVSVLISLMQAPPEHQVETSALQVHHLPIEDLTPPSLAQVEAFARLLSEAQEADKAVAVHCFAGVGRTTTMLVAAHLLAGESFAALSERISEQNPHYQRKGRQWAFLRSLAQEKGHAR